jgi:hypothetical protein
MIQVNAAHLLWYVHPILCVWVNGEPNTSPIMFAILIGNEDKEGWDHFWRFMLDLHPCLNCEIMTIMTDQQKGSKAAIKNVLPNVQIFHCSQHQANNITKSLRQFSYVLLFILL